MKEFLTFKSGKFYFTTGSETEQIKGLIIQATVLNETITELPILPELSSRINPDIMYSSIAGTAAIEGNPITKDDVRKIADGEDSDDYTQKHRQEIMNLIEAYTYMDSLIPVVEPLPVTEELVLHLHSLITKNVLHDRNVPGKYRDGLVHVGDNAHGGVYTPPKILPDVKNLMSVYLEWINSDELTGISPFIRGALAHYYLCIIHPFWDGNGRTARLLEAILLHSAAFRFVPKDLSNYYYRNVDSYYIAISDSIRLKKDNSPFLEFSLGGIVASLQAVKTLIIFFIRKFALRDFYRYLKQIKDISNRQYELLNLLLDNADSFSLGDLNEKRPLSILYREVSVQTARRDMKKLTDSNLLKRDEEGKYSLNLKILG